MAYRCDECGFTCSAERYLERHSLTKHQRPIARTDPSQVSLQVVAPDDAERQPVSNAQATMATTATPPAPEPSPPHPRRPPTPSFSMQELEEIHQPPRFPSVANWREDDDGGDDIPEERRRTPSDDAARYQENDSYGYQRWNEGDLAEEEFYFAEIDDLRHRADTPASVQTDATLDQDERQELYPRQRGAGQPCGPADKPMATMQRLLENPWHPFTSAQDFTLARWFIQSSIAKTHINSYFALPIHDDTQPASFASAYQLDAQLSEMKEKLPEWIESRISDGNVKQPFYHRNPIECVKYLLGQSVYDGKFHWAPTRKYVPVYDDDGKLEFDRFGRQKEQRRYTSLWDSNYTWETQDSLPDLATQVPIVISTDATQLTRFGGKLKHSIPSLLPI